MQSIDNSKARMLSNTTNDLLNLSKKKVLFIYEVCSPEEFTFLEKVIKIIYFDSPNVRRFFII